MLILLVLITVSRSLLAPPVTSTFPVIHEDYLLEAVLFVESAHNPKAFNEKENAAGIAQLRPIMIAEANEIVGYKKYSLKDRWNVRKSIEIWYVIQDYHNPSYDPITACLMWNAGNANSKVNISNYISKIIAYDNRERSLSDSTRQRIVWLPGNREKSYSATAGRSFSIVVLGRGRTQKTYSRYRL